MPTGHGCALPSRHLPLPAGILLTPATCKLFLPPTDTHPVPVFPVSASMCSSSCWESEGRCSSPPQRMGWAGTLHHSGHCPLCSRDKELPRAILGFCVPLETEVQTRGGNCSGVLKPAAGEGQNHCCFSGKTSSLPIPLELFLHMENPKSRLPAVCAASWCLCAPAARLRFLWKK